MVMSRGGNRGGAGFPARGVVLVPVMAACHPQTGQGPLNWGPQGRVVGHPGDTVGGQRGLYNLEFRATQTVTTVKQINNNHNKCLKTH